MDENNNYFCVDNCPLSRKFYIPEIINVLKIVQRQEYLFIVKVLIKLYMNMKILVLKIVLINIKINEKDLICEYNSEEW